uniref:Uncharacterized protein n=1 Tax=Anopheles atroparvus TaxID=41427 RepID=A0A182IV03_ANOAO
MGRDIERDKGEEIWSVSVVQEKLGDEYSLSVPMTRLNTGLPAISKEHERQGILGGAHNTITIKIKQKREYAKVRRADSRRMKAGYARMNHTDERRRAVPGFLPSGSNTTPLKLVQGVGATSANTNINDDDNDDDEN